MKRTLAPGIPSVADSQVEFVFVGKNQPRLIISRLIGEKIRDGINGEAEKQRGIGAVTLAEQRMDWDGKHLIGVGDQVPTRIAPKDARLQRCDPGYAEKAADHRSDPEVDSRYSHGQMTSQSYSKGLVAAWEMFGDSTVGAG